MKLRFDPAFDGNTWPGELEAHPASLGQTRVGPTRLLSHLETALGLGGLYPSSTERAAALIPALRDIPGYWSESFAADAFSTARRLIRDRDSLILRGWRAQPVTDRIGQLAAATTGVRPGLACRLAVVIEALATRTAAIERIELPKETKLPQLWNDLLTGLASQGTEIARHDDPQPSGQGDLRGAQTNELTPTGDGTLQLVRPYGPARAAEEIAAWLAAQPSLEGTVIVSPNAVLDHALHAYGLPTTGATAAPPELSSILPLVLELGWSPQDPQQAHELLTIPDGPVPRVLATRLVRALQQWPAVGSDKWQAKLDEGLATIDADDRRERVADRIKTIFRQGPSRRDNRYPSDELQRRTRLIQQWAKARSRRTDHPASFESIVEQCAILLRLVESASLESLGMSELRRWTRVATDETRHQPRYPAQAGLAAVDRPDAIAGPARIIIWWNFHLGTAPHPERQPWSLKEQQALRDIAVDIPDRGAEASEMARRWRRPLIHATESLLLVCPRRGDDGEELHPHPLWDEIEAAIPTNERMRGRERLTCQRPDLLRAAEQTVVEPLRLPSPRRDWQVAQHRLELRESESPSSVASLLGCPLQWCLKYQGRMSDSLAEPPSGIDNRLKGNVAHEVLHRLVLLDDLDATNAASHAERLFDEVIASNATPLLLPGADAERGAARHEIVRAAATLVSMLGHGSFRVTGAETHRAAPAFGTQLAGYSDLVLNPAAVVDYKWGGRTTRTDELKNGTAAQLAAYARMVAGESGVLPPVAYLIISGQNLLTTTPDRFPGSVGVDGPGIDTTWRALDIACRARAAAFGEGRLVAPGNPSDDTEAHGGKDALIGDRLDVAPACKYCDFAALCGRSFGAQP